MLAAHNVREDNSHVHCLILHLLYTIQLQSFVVQTFRDTTDNRKNINVHKKNFVIVLFFCVVIITLPMVHSWLGKSAMKN